MSGFYIAMVIAVILFARLGIRLVTRFIEMKNDDDNDKSD